MACTLRSSKSKRVSSGVFLCFRVLLCFRVFCLCRFMQIPFDLILLRGWQLSCLLVRALRLCLLFPSLLSLCSHFQHRNPHCLTKALFLFITRAISHLHLTRTGFSCPIDCTSLSSSLHVYKYVCYAVSYLSEARISFLNVILSFHVALSPHPQMFTAGLAAPCLPVAPRSGVSARWDDIL